MIKRFCLIAGIFAILTLIGVGIERHVSGSSDGSPPLREETTQTQQPPTPKPEPQQSIIYARILHERDVLQPNVLFVEAKAYPGDGDLPNIKGGYAETNVQLSITIKGISVPSACQTAEERNKPHDEVEIERERWQKAIDYVWGCVSQSKKLRLAELEIIDGQVHCHVDFFLGGAWHDLSTALVHDDHARYKRPGIRWKWGSRLLDPIPTETETP